MTRRRLAALLAWLLYLPLLGGSAFAQSAGEPVASDWRTEQWGATWGAAPAGPPLTSNTTYFNNQTLRLIVHTSTAGSRVRVRLSNEMGTSAVTIGGARVALRSNGAATVAGSDRMLTFGGAAGVVLQPGAAALSDAVDLAVPALGDLAVSLYLPSYTASASLHPLATQTSYVSAAGNYSAATSFPVQGTIEQWPFLTEVDVSGASGAIVALGDSITDGLRSWGDYNYRWPDWLARRLQGSGSTSTSRLGVVNRGIAGNRLLTNPQVGSLAGRAAIERLDRDVFASAGVRYLVVLLGVNDLINSSSSSPLSASDLIAGYRQIIARAHLRGIAVYIGTITPFEGADYYTSDKELVRQATNNWIRSSTEFEGMIDFDRLLRDSGNPRRLISAYDSGDHLHPNNAGYQAMGNAVPLTWFSGGAVVSVPAPASEGAVAGVEGGNGDGALAGTPAVPAEGPAPESASDGVAVASVAAQ